MKIHESALPDGTLAPILLDVADDGALVVTTHEGAFPLVDGAVEAVMTKYGRPLETREPVAEVARLTLPGGGVLRHVRHLARYDVIARDFLVLDLLDGRGDEALCALAVTVSAAIVHLARAQRDVRAVDQDEDAGSR